MSSGYLATDYTTPHDLHLELLKVDQLPTSVYGGRPNVFAVVYLERHLSAPITVAPNIMKVSDPHEFRGGVGGGGSGVSFAGTTTTTAATGSTTTAASSSPASCVRVGRTNIINQAPLQCNLETKLCISHCHDREVVRVTIYDHVESARGFLGTCLVPVGGPLRDYGKRTVPLEGPTNMSLELSWEMADSSSAKGQYLTASLMAAAVAGGDLAEEERRSVVTADEKDPLVLATLKSREEAQWRDRYGCTIVRVSARDVSSSQNIPSAAPAAALGGMYAVPSAVDVAPTAGDASRRQSLVPTAAVAAAPADLIASTGDAATAAAASNTNGGAFVPPSSSSTARESHLEAKVRELEDALLAVAKNRDDLVQRELLRRVAGGEVNVLAADGTVSAPNAAAAAGSPAAMSTAAGGRNLMALTVKDLTSVAAQGHGTLSYALAQSAARDQLATLLGAAETSSPASSTVAALRAAKERAQEDTRHYYSSDLMAMPRASSSSQQHGSSPSSRMTADAQTATSSMLERQCPNLMAVIKSPSKALAAEDEALLMAYRGPRALYESDATAMAKAHSVLLGGTTIDFPSLLPHHGHAMAASYVLGTDTITHGMQQGLPPLLASASVSTSMPLSYAKNSLKFRVPPTVEQLTSKYGVSSSNSLYSSARGSPTSPAKAAAFAAASHPFAAVGSNNTVLNDIAVASMYPTSAPIHGSDPYYQDNTAAWKRALAHRDTHVAVEGTKVVSPHGP